jgi:hypothetical protein
MKVSVPFVKGLQTKVEHQILPVGDLTLLENGEFNKIGSIEKRKGYSSRLIEGEADLISHGGDLIARNVSSDPSGVPLSAKTYSLANGGFMGMKGVSQGIGYTSMPVSAGSSYRQENPQAAFSDDGKYALVTFVALESKDTATSGEGDGTGLLEPLTGTVTKKCTLVDRGTNTVIASDIPLGRHHGQGDVSATEALGSPVYKYQGSRMKPIWRNGKFYVFGVDAKATGVTATPYEPTLNIYCLDPARELIQVSNLSGEYGETATHGTEITLPSGWSIPNKINASWPYGPDAQKNYGFSFDVCSHATDGYVWILLTLYDGSVYKTELHEVSLTGTSVALTSPKMSHDLGQILNNPSRPSYMENAVHMGSDGSVYYAFLGLLVYPDPYDQTFGDDANCIELRKYIPSTDTGVILNTNPTSFRADQTLWTGAGGHPHVDSDGNTSGNRPKISSKGFYRGFFIENDRPKKDYAPMLGIGIEIDVDFYLSQVPLHSLEQDVQTGTGSDSGGEVKTSPGDIDDLFRNSAYKNKTFAFESLNNHTNDNLDSYPIEKLVYRPVLFAFGHEEGDSPKGPVTVGAYSYDILGTSERASYNELNTVELFTSDISETIFSEGRMEKGGQNLLPRGHLSLLSFDPSQIRDAAKVANYSGDAEGLTGRAVALPVVTNFNTYDGKLIPNSVIHLFDFRGYGEKVPGPVVSSAVLSDILYVADDGLFSYDGSSFWPHGIVDKPSIFIDEDPPETLSGTGPTSGGFYSYKGVYEWEDARGNLHQGAPSGIAAYTAPASGKTEVSVEFWAATQGIIVDELSYSSADMSKYSKRNMRLAVYRTSANGSLLTLNNVVPVTSSTSDASSRYQDNKSDTENAIGRFLYTDSGELANTPPPSPSVYVIAHKNRLFTIGQDGLIYFSKLAVPGFGLGFHPGFVIRTPDRISDPPMALGSMDGVLYIFTKNKIYFLNGEGPDNTGAGAFYEPKPIPTVCGAIERSPILLIDQGLLFISAKGIFILGRDQKVDYIGSPVEDVLNGIVTDMVLDQEKECAYFLTSASDGVVLSYNYRLQQWGTFLLPVISQSGGGDKIESVALWKDRLRFASDDRLWSEDASLTMDVLTSGSEDKIYIPLRMKTAWIKVESSQGYQRTYNFQVLGTSKGAHKLNVIVRYDYDKDSKGDKYSFVTTDNDEKPLQFRGHLKKQKCQAIQFEIYDEPADEDAKGTITTGEGYSITEIALEIGYKADQYKNGLMRLSNTATRNK